MSTVQDSLWTDAVIQEQAAHCTLMAPDQSPLIRILDNREIGNHAARNIISIACICLFLLRGLKEDPGRVDTCAATDSGACSGSVVYERSGGRDHHKNSITSSPLVAKLNNSCKLARRRGER